MVGLSYPMPLCYSVKAALSYIAIVGYCFLDAKATQVFGGVDGPAFLSGVRCTGLEEELIACSDGGTGDEGCASAGVTCASESIQY